MGTQFTGKNLFLVIVRVWIYLFIVVLGLLLLFFSNPNRLAHDQIHHKTAILSYENPGIFNGDFLWGDPRSQLTDNYYPFLFFGWLNSFTGGDEMTRWLLLPIIFVVFTIGFFELLFVFSGNLVISLIIAIAANFHIPNTFTAEWGLPGPSELDPWAFYQMFLPVLYFLLVAAIIKSRKILLYITFAFAGLLANLHIISAFYFITPALLTFLLVRGLKKVTIGPAVIAGFLSLLFSLPFLLRHYLAGVAPGTSFDPSDPVIYTAIKESAFHVTLPGRYVNALPWLKDYWFTIWPLIGIFLFILWQHRRLAAGDSQRLQDKISVFFVASVISVNVAFSALQIFRYLFLHQLPFWNEPRGLQYVYLVLLPYAAIFLVWLWSVVQRWFTFQRTILAIIGLVAVGLAAFVRLQPWLGQKYLKHITPRFSYRTCDSNLYRAIASLTLPDGVILQDPDYWSAFRICVRRPVVVQGRERAFAYTLGTDMLLEWYRRYHEAVRAFQVGGDELLRVAKKYDSRIIVSRTCVPVDPEQLALREEVAGEGCIYITKP